MTSRGVLTVVKQFFSEVFKRHTEDDAEQVVIVGAIGTIPDPATLTSECPRPWLYTRVFAFFLLTTALLFVANVLTNFGQFSNVLVIGAFAAPFTVLVFIFEFNVYRNISFYTVLKALFIGGALSLIATAVLPSFWFLNITSVTDAFAAGVGEEVAKLLVVYWILKRNRAYPYILNGLLVGAAVGAGFAIFETAGYGMTFLIRGDNAWIGKESMFVLALRNLLAPGGHVVWAAISGAGLLLAARREPLSATIFRRRQFVVAFLVSIVLHVLWDMPFFESGWCYIGWLLTLTLAAWFVVAWFLRRGLEEVDMMRSIVLYKPERLCHSQLIAGPWRRWAARTLDFLCGGIVVFVVLCKIADYFGLGESLNMANKTIMTVVALPFLLLLEGVIYELFGTTFGKWAFSLRVCDDIGKDASSKVYFNRLVRLWISGLGLFIPIVSLFAPVVQCNRLSTVGQTSYDGVLGLRVVKERIHLLRWLVVLPVLMAVGLLGVACVLGEEEGEGANEMPKSADARIEKAISSAGLKYVIGDDGVCIIKFSLSGKPERTQLCVVSQETVDVSGSECMLICSVVANHASVQKDDLSRILSENVDRHDRIWCKVGECLALRLFVSLDVSPELLRGAIERLAEDADAAEQKLTGKDEC